MLQADNLKAYQSCCEAVLSNHGEERQTALVCLFWTRNHSVTWKAGCFNEIPSGYNGNGGYKRWGKLKDN